jgi:hypothetical protein
LIVTVAVLGVPRKAPPWTLVKETPKLRVPANGVALESTIVKLFGSASPSCQISVPLADVYSVPAVAVPSVVA